ncbi:hypothetical protein EYF80_020612 [Liparis tanakae]|uniref:Uncharacterized protein n=1 Tax=Liparis tanakae TaxID=230148 RepID=A0A4Z2HV21_9TELE|nr:hypothetical protein EYF80_020612 [Liparis tanakae]
MMNSVERLQDRRVTASHYRGGGRAPSCQWKIFIKSFKGGTPLAQRKQPAAVTEALQHWLLTGWSSSWLPTGWSCGWLLTAWSSSWLLTGWSCGWLLMGWSCSWLLTG